MQGYQNNNGSPMGFGQPQQNKDGKKPNFMEDVMGYYGNTGQQNNNNQYAEPIAPGIPAAQIGSSLPGNGQQGFSGSGTGWRGLDLNPVNNFDPSKFNGFNLDRAMKAGDPNSTKDAFARWASGLGPLQGLSKEQIGQLITNNLDSAKKMGLNITGVMGDKIQIDAKEHGSVWNDVVSDAGGVNPQWWWNPELPNNGPYVPRKPPAVSIYEQYQNQLKDPLGQDEQSIEDLLVALMSQNQELI